jgi:hypothetical protein
VKGGVDGVGAQGIVVIQYEPRGPSIFIHIEG